MVFVIFWLLWRQHGNEARLCNRLTRYFLFSFLKVLYDNLDIADWILPMVYQGHLRHLVWVHPPWAQQIPDVQTDFFVGKNKENEQLQ